MMAKRKAPAGKPASDPKAEAAVWKWFIAKMSPEFERWLPDCEAAARAVLAPLGAAEWPHNLPEMPRAKRSAQSRAVVAQRIMTTAYTIRQCIDRGEYAAAAYFAFELGRYRVLMYVTPSEIEGQRNGLLKAQAAAQPAIEQRRLERVERMAEALACYDQLATRGLKKSTIERRVLERTGTKPRTLRAYLKERES